MKKVRFSRIKQLQAEVERLSANLCTAVKERDENVTIYQTNLAAKDKQLAEANKKLSDAIMALTHAWESLTGKRIILPAEGLGSSLLRR